MTENNPKKLETLLTELSKNQKEMLEWKKEQSQSTGKPSSSNQHTHSANVAFDCPDCQKEYDASVIEKATPGLLAGIKEKLKSGKLQICDDCGEIVDAEEDEECPSCKGETSHRID